MPSRTPANIPMQTMVPSKSTGLRVFSDFPSNSMNFDPPVPVGPPGTSFLPINFSDEGYIDIDLKTDGQHVWPDYQALHDTLFNTDGVLLRISFWNWTIGGVGEADLLRTGRASILLRMHLGLLCSKIGRWHAIQIDAQLFNFFVGNNMWDVNERRSPYHLKSIGIQHIDPRTDLSDLNEFLRLASAPRLYIGDSTERMDIKSAFPLHRFEKLTHLKINNFSVSSEQILRVLQATWDLEECVVSDVTEPSPSKKMHCAYLPKLTRMKLEINMNDFDQNINTGAICDLLAMIATPFLEELSVGYENEWNFEAFKPFYAPQLKKLHFIGTTMEAHQLLNCLQRFPKIEELVLDTPIEHWRGPSFTAPILLTEEICERLTYNRSGQYLCPELKCLAIRDNCIQPTIGGAFGQMLKIRKKHTRFYDLVLFGESHSRISLSEADHQAVSELSQTRGMYVRYM